jgi:LmbE family N-acetylglucosaminyl deacetylase
MVIVEPPAAESIMAIAAHPDDIESWCAGTLALAIDRGASVRLLLVTSGEVGSSDLTASATTIAGLREAEARTAADQLGIADVVFLRQPDGEIEATRALRVALVEWIRRWRPAVVFTHDPEQPWPPYLSHRDHRVVGRAALDAVYPLARDVRACPELARAGLPPHAVESVWLFASSVADSLVDITPSFGRKIAARLAHASQTPDPATLLVNWRARAAAFGAPAGLALAEAFTVVQID